MSLSDLSVLSEFFFCFLFFFFRKKKKKKLVVNETYPFLLFGFCSHLGRETVSCAEVWPDNKRLTISIFSPIIAEGEYLMLKKMH